MRRREFIALTGGAAVWPFAARAQQPMSVVGVLWPGQTPPGSPRMESFTQALRQLGFVEGQNLSIELRYAREGLQQVPQLAAELVRLKVDVLVTFGDFTPKAAQQATDTIEGDMSWVTKQGISNGIPPFATVVSDITREHWLGTGRVCIGVTPVDGRLFYVTGGFAAAGVEAIVATNIARDGSLAATQTRWGWTAGGGFEAAFSELVVQARISLCRLAGQKLLSTSHNNTGLYARQAQRHFE